MNNKILRKCDAPASFVNSKKLTAFTRITLKSYIWFYKFLHKGLNRNEIFCSVVVKTKKTLSNCRDTVSTVSSFSIGTCPVDASSIYNFDITSVQSECNGVKIIPAFT